MNVRTLCLSILFDEQATGYDIRRMCTEGTCSYFVDASFGSIYPALSRLEDDGLVTSRTEQQTGKPARKIYEITEAGRSAFLEELKQPLGPDLFRSPFLLFARFAHLLPRDLVAKRCQEFLERSENDLKQLEAETSEIQCSPADAWVVNYGRAVLSLAQAHVRAHMHELIAIARPPARTIAAE